MDTGPFFWRSVCLVYSTFPIFFFKALVFGIVSGGCVCCVFYASQIYLF